MAGASLFSKDVSQQASLIYEQKGVFHKNLAYIMLGAVAHACNASDLGG